MTREEPKEQQAQGWLTSASNLRGEAERLKDSAPAESVAASQRCIELSAKSMFAILGAEFDKEHGIKQQDFSQLMGKVPENLEYLRFPRLLLLEQFWAKFRSVAEYGFEILGVPQGKLFGKEEAELALKHAGECHWAASQLINRILYSQ
jgi:HEPN domain-containing protein